METAIKHIILDRDGVINVESEAYIKTVEEWLPIPGSIEAIAKLCQAGFAISIATNQSGIGRGYYSYETLALIHAKMTSLIEAAGGHISAIVFCPHLPENNCGCRKPHPGLLKQILSTAQLQPEQTIMVGDSYRDYEAAHACGIDFFLVKTGNGSKTLKKYNRIFKPKQVYNDLASFAEQLLSHHQIKITD